MSFPRSFLQASTRPLVYGLVAVMSLALAEAALADRKRGSDRERHYHRSSQRHHYNDRSKHRKYYRDIHPRYRHHDRFPRWHYYDRPSYYYDPPRQGIRIQF